ncbi:MAG: hypothetical protein HY372_01700 [Candidatus Andersenbacteria bacterium]|nr:hypothetical protein [Candidatus Andersenbacteria bacterium]
MIVDALALRLPHRGTVSAGWPSPAEEELNDTLTFEEWLVPRKDRSCLITVATSALRTEGILPGDIAIMERGRTPRPGNIVVAAINGSPIIRRFARPHAPPRTDDTASEVRLLGVVTAIIRRYR